MFEDPDAGSREPLELIERLRGFLGDRYDIEREIGAGGAATVFLARDRRHARSVAIKVLRQRVTAASSPERFRREIAIAAQLTHPHIVPLHDSGVAGDAPYYVMPFVAGETLKAHLAGSGALPFAEALAIARDVAEALDYAHGRGVVHRDIKPSNILLTADHALVTDFGVARALEAATLQDVTETTGGYVGTPAYMSPEQALGEDEVDGRSDVYALGCVVYEMLSGERAFGARTPVGLIAQHVQGAIPDLPATKSIPAHAAGDIERALAKDPAGRFATAGDFVAALAGKGAPPGGGAMRSRWAVAGVVVIAALALVLAGLQWLGRGPSPLEDGRPYSSFAVLPFETSTSTDAERSLAADLAADIGVELNYWDSIYAVPRVALAGPMFDLGLSGATLSRVEDGIEVARSLGVQAMLVVQVQSKGDSLSAQGALYDVETRRPTERPIQATGGSDVSSLARRIAYAVLGLDDPGPDGVELHRRSSNREALRAFTLGTRALQRWRLAEAETDFREATADDSTFSLAYQRLAMTLYWGAASSPRALRRVGPEISRWSAEAVRTSAGLSAQDSLHVRGFHAFQGGDYPLARQLYGRLLDAQPTDVYAWVMLGSIQFLDPWLTRADGVLRPRASYNAAIRSFETALRLQPTFELGYGQLFAIHRSIARAAHTATCVGFEEPRAELLTPWDPREPDRQVTFCPVVGDSVTWMEKSSETDSVIAASRERADLLFRQSLRMVRRWTEFAPDQARPWEELANELTSMRLTLGVAAPEELRRLAGEARDALGEGLALSADTAVEALYRLANLQLAAGDRDGAARTVEATRARFGGTPPDFSANLYAATGRLREAMAVLPPDRIRLFLEDPDDGSLIAQNGAEEVFDRLGVLAGVTLPQGMLPDALAEIESHWSGATYDDHDRELLREDAMERILAALAVDPASAAGWSAKVESDKPLWLALTRPGLAVDSVRALIASAGIEDQVGSISRASFSFVAGQLSFTAGDPAAARRWFSRLDSIAALTDSFTPAWSLQAVAPYWRGRVEEAEGDADAAIDSYRAFVATWEHGDDLAMRMVDDARGRISQLTRTP